MKRCLFAVLLMAPPVEAQDTLRLGALQAMAVEGDPRAAELGLHEAASELRIANIGAERLPQLRAGGEASYQSDVPAIPLEMLEVEAPRAPKDRYELSASAVWLLYDGGRTAARRRVASADLEVARAELAAELFPLRSEVTRAFFAALLAQERLAEIGTLAGDLEARLSETRVRVEAGAALPGDSASVLAELLTTRHRESELESTRRSSIAVLERLTGQDIGEGDVLAVPELSDHVARLRASLYDRGAGTGRLHPQYAVFAAERDRIAREAALVRASSNPEVSGVGQLAYGRPGPRQFTNAFDEYHRAGLQLSWSPWDWGARGRRLEILHSRRQVLQAREAALSRTIERELERPLDDMDRLEAALRLDDRIIALREQLERQAQVQLGEHEITGAQYLELRNDLHMARLRKRRHETERARAQAEFLLLIGVELPEPARRYP